MLINYQNFANGIYFSYLIKTPNSLVRHLGKKKKKDKETVKLKPLITQHYSDK